MSSQNANGAFLPVCFAIFPITEKRVENTKRSGVFFNNFEVFENAVEQLLEYLICLLNQN